MISLSLSGLVFFYAVAFLAVIGLVWFGCEVMRKIRENRACRYWLQCMICGMAYEDRSTTELPRCPRCGSLNERLKVKTY